MIDIRIGDCRQLIHDLDNESIDCVMTSPPYWGLRDYKTEPIIFDGAQDCEHEWVEHRSGLVHENRNNCKGTQEDVLEQTGTVYIKKYDDKTAGFCSKCGAWRGQLGLEPTPELYVKHMLGFFDDVKMKLKSEGNCFVNLGDTYAGYWGNKNGDGTEYGNIPVHGHNQNKRGKLRKVIDSEGIQPKSLCMIPQRFAWGMIERGWILRNEIIWAKPNHMPESVTDRLTKAHEVIYHFVRQQKYYYNLDAIRRPVAESTIGRGKVRFGGAKGKTYKDGLKIGDPNFRNGSEQWGREFDYTESCKKGCNPGDVWEYSGKFEGNQDAESFGSPRARTQRKNDGTNYGGNGAGIQNHSGNSLNHPLGKNPGDVWSITTQPYPESHFAVFPLELVRRPILAGCPIGGTVLDPFAGSGTVGKFCRHNDRNAILFELNPEYGKLIKERSMANIPELESYND